MCNIILQSVSYHVTTQQSIHDPMATEVISNYPKERELSRSEEEERLLREIREEKERLWVEISVR